MKYSVSTIIASISFPLIMLLYRWNPESWYPMVMMLVLMVYIGYNQYAKDGNEESKR